MRTLIETKGIIRSVHIKGSGPSLLLLHGFTGTMNTWTRYIDKWSNRYQVIAVDIVGHGRTQAPNDLSYFSMEHEMNALLELLDHFNVEKTHIAGYSMGARLALYMKVNAPTRVDGLLMESGSPGLAESQDRVDRCHQDELLAKKIKDQGLEEFINYWETIPLFNTQKALQDNVKSRIRKERLSQTTEGLTNSLLGMGTGSQPSLWEDLKQIDGPVHFVAGQLDSKFGDIAKMMAWLTPKAICHIVTHSGHAIHVEQSKVFDRIVYESFYQTISEGR